MKCLAGFLALSVLCSLGCSSTSESVPRPRLEPTAEDAVADAYIRCQERRDYEAMGELLAEDALYQDFTMEFFDREAIELRGRQAIADFFRGASEDADAREICYRVRERMSVGAVVVLVTDVYVRSAGEPWGVAVDEVENEVTQVVFLRIEDGLIQHHVDHVDYRTWMAQIQELKDQPSPK